MGRTRSCHDRDDNPFAQQLEIGEARDKIVLDPAQEGEEPTFLSVINSHGSSVVRCNSIRSTEAKVLSFKHARGLQVVKNMAELYKIDSPLGAGAFGEVYKAFHNKAEV